MKLRTLLYAVVSTISAISCNAGITDSDFKRAPFGDIPANKQIVTNVEDVVTKISDELNNIKTDVITDGTNLIDAAGNVFLVETSNFSEWVKTADESGISFSSLPNWKVGGSGEGWYVDVPDDQGFPSYYLGNTRDATRVECGAVPFATVWERTAGLFAKTNYVGKLALTNDVPPAVTVAAPSTNATTGTAADAKATGTALYTGFTEWECTPSELYSKKLHIVHENGEWSLYADNQFLDPTIDGPNDATNLTFSVHGVTATRHLVTPTKTSHLENDSGFITSAELDGKFDKTGGSITGNVTIVNGALKLGVDSPSVIDSDAEGLWLSSTPFNYDGFTPRSQSFLFTRGKGTVIGSSRGRVVLVQEDLDAVTNNYKFYAGEWKFTGNADYPSLVFTNNQWELTIGQGRFRRTITAPGNADDKSLVFSDNGSLITAEFGVDKFKDRTVNEVYHKSGTDLSISFPDQAIGYSRDFYMFLRSQQGVQTINFVGSNGEVIKWSGKEPPSVFTGTTNIVRFTEVSPSCFLYQDCLGDSLPELTPVYGENGNTLIGYTLGDQTDKVFVTTNDHIVIGPNNTTISARPNVLGSDIQMGSKAWYYSAIVFSTNVVGKPATIYLTDDVTKRNTGVTTTNISFQSGYAVGDVISLVNKAKYDNSCKVTAVNGNVITVDTIPFTSIVSGQTDYDDYIVASTNKPAFGVVSLGDYSFAMGSGHRVYRRLDTVFGRDNAAIGDYALLGGRQNVGAYASFAAGRDNIAIGQYSTAVGNHTEALADRAHAEGYYTRASGVASHTEGAGTAADLLTASGDYSHAEGSRTKATGTTSHAEGNLSQAQFASTHAEGEQTKASSSYSHAEGYRTEAGNGTANGGWCSHAEGNSTKSTGQNSHAEGLTTRAIGQNSHAEGNYTIASGKSSHAEGSGISSLYSISTGAYSHVEGACTYANGDSSHAEGYLTVAYGGRSHAEGGARNVSKSYKVFWAGTGSSYTSSVNHDLVVNDIVEVNGECRLVTGVVNTKKFNVDSAFPGVVSNSTINVRQGVSLGTESHSEGRYSTSIGTASHAEGFTTRVSGDYAHAEGQRTYAEARGAHVEGVGATDSEALNLYGAKAIASHVEGIRCLSESGAQGGHAEGMGTVVRNHSEHAQGRYNVSHMSTSTFGHAGNTLHSIGFGYSANARSNVVEVMQNGKVFVCGVGGYNGTNPTGSNVKDLATVVVESSYPYLKQFDWDKYPDPGADTLTYDGYRDTADGYGIFLNFGITGYSSWFFPDAFETTNIATTVANNIVGNLGDPNKITDGSNTIKADRTVIQPIYTFGAWNITVTPNDEYTPSLSSDDIHWINTEDELEGRTPFSGTGWYLFDGGSSIIIGTDFNITNSVLTNYGSSMNYTVVCSRTASISGIITNKVALISDLPTAYMPMTPDGIVRTQNGFYSFGMNDKDGHDDTNTVVVIDGGHYDGATLIINGAEGKEENGIKIYGASIGSPRGDILVNGVSVLGNIDNIDKKQDALTTDQTNAINSGVTAEKVQKWDGNLDWTEYYFPKWEYGVTYKGNSQEPVRYRVSYNGRVYTRTYSEDTVQTEDPFNSSGWIDVTTSFTNNNRLCRAEGYGTLAAGLYSHAEGYRTYAVTDKTIGSTAAHAEGSRSRAVGDASHAEGRYTLADMHASHAEGLESHANAQYAHAEGDKTVTYGKASHAEGFRTVAGLETDTLGTTTNSAYAHAEGLATMAVAIGAHSEGTNTVASGYASHAEGGIRNGEGSVASGDYSHAEGSGSKAFGEGSHAEGGSTVASNKYSHAEGLETIARGQYSHAEGSGTEARKDGTHAEGRKTIADHIGVHVEGRFAMSAHQNSFIWSGVNLTSDINNTAKYYKSNATGSFNINPVGGTDGFYIGKTNLTTIISNAMSSGISTNALAGKTYDFSTNVGLYTAVRDIVQALGGTVTNFPAINQ